MDLEVLRKVGLSDGEIRVYSAMMDSGLSTVNEIHEKVGIERRNIYDILNKLIERGLVSYTNENNRRRFNITHPEKIINYIEEKKQHLETIEGELKQNMPELVKKFEFLKPAINAEVFRGIEGVKAIWDDALNYEESYWIGSGNYVPDKLPHFYRSWDKRRMELKRKRYNLFRNEIRGKAIRARFHYVRFLPEEFSGNPTAILIYGNKVVNLILGSEFFAFVIESEEMAESYKRYFWFLWKNVAKP